MKQTKKPVRKSKTKNAVYAVVGIAAALVIAAILLFSGQKGYDTAKTAINSPAASTQVNDMVIQKSGITETAAFIPYKAGNTDMEVIAVKASDGTIRTALNTCQVCYDSGRGYYVQKGDELVCQNCGNRFKISQVEKIKNGCNPVPIMNTDKTEDDNTITISGAFLTANKELFADWKR